MPDEEPTLPHTVETDRNALANTTAAATALAKLSEALDAAASLQECDSIQKQRVGASRRWGFGLPGTSGRVRGLTPRQPVVH